jgi:hypothetical protein
MLRREIRNKNLKLERLSCGKDIANVGPFGCKEKGQVSHNKTRHILPQISKKKKKQMTLERNNMLRIVYSKLTI